MAQSYWQMPGGVSLGNPTPSVSTPGTAVEVGGNTFTPDNSKRPIEDFPQNQVGQATSPTNSGTNSAYSIASDKDFWEWFKNAYAGDEDYKRQLDLMEREQAFSASEAQKLRDWQEGLSNTAIRRAVEDAKAAGLNPYTVLHSAQQASTPGGAVGYSGTRSSVQSGANTARLLSALFTALGNVIGKYAGRSNIYKFFVN